MEQDVRWQVSLEQLGQAIIRLGLALNEPESNPLFIDATIQRFEITIELFWKTLRHLLALEGKAVFSPKESLQAAYQLGWLHNEAVWLSILKDRNLTSHTYHEELAEQVVVRIRSYYPEMERICQFLKERFPKPQHLRDLHHFS